MIFGDNLMSDFRNWAIGLLTAMLLAFGSVFWSTAQSNLAATISNSERLTHVEAVVTIELRHIHEELKKLNGNSE